jgi:hypothetical protein
MEILVTNCTASPIRPSPPNTEREGEEAFRGFTVARDA